MHLVAHDRPAERAADLLVRIGQHALGDLVGGVELVVAEEAVDAAAVGVGPRLGDGLHLDTGRAALSDVEQVRHDLELGNSLTAEARLAEPRSGNLLRDLLAVEIELEHVVAHARRVDDVVGGDALHHVRQLDPIAPLQRKRLHLAAIDVAADL